MAASGADEFLMIVREITERKRQQEELGGVKVTHRRRRRRGPAKARAEPPRRRAAAARLAVAVAAPGPGPAGKEPRGGAGPLERSREELAAALEELRELARGIHPAILTDRGLEAALEALAARSPLPVEIEGLQVELPPNVEAAAYYVVSEALANVTKYAQASLVKVSVGQENGYALVEVVDDGVGGADPLRGSGLSGLSDRLASLSGKLSVSQPAGRGDPCPCRDPSGVG